ncbi:hypothetical protein [Paraburkholderia antibiotica]|uniref:Uncharacterized protein n=1 Tax=Paraburkholderia antibiotica TaxID=2728839 RepID=A0A7X9ZYA3_9BURK|nr:hypothetical protein [Paraburkholderia antibiotica]NML32934.1 hypothetical protein [Paraburkholderia antibiotica]
MFLTYIAVVAIAAFIPYVAAPAIAKGVQSIQTPPAATSFEMTPAEPLPAATGSDASNRIVPARQGDGGVGGVV